MTIREIIKMGDPRLLAENALVGDVQSPEIQGLIADLWETMVAAKGAGIAAPQIGVNVQVCVFGAHVPNPRYPDRPLVPPTVLINPSIEPLEPTLDDDWEGCLSIPGLRGMVPRYRHILYRGLNAHGEPFERQAHGFHARVVQHECDHLWQTLYTMRMADLRQLGYTEVLFPEIAAAEQPVKPE